MNVRTIDFEKDFSPYPGGRYKTDGEYSGEHFREDLLIPALDQSEKVVLQMDGALGYPMSFLEEAFGPLTKEQSAKIEVRHADDTLQKRISSVVGSRAYCVYGKCSYCDDAAIGWYDYTVEGPALPLCQEHANEEKSKNEAE